MKDNKLNEEIKLEEEVKGIIRGESTSANSLPSIPPSLLEKLWESYSSIDEKRRKTFYYLYSVMVGFSLLWITKEHQISLPFFQTKVDAGMALSFTPAFISILTIRYLYLCAYSTISFKNYLRFYQYAHKDDLSRLGITFVQLTNLFKLRDLTEKLNLYMFPIKNINDENSRISMYLQQIVNFLLNIVVLLSIIIPLTGYISIVIWLGIWSEGLTITFVGRLLYSVYVLMGIGLMFLPFHFHFRIRFTTEKMKIQISLIENSNTHEVKSNDNW